MLLMIRVILIVLIAIIGSTVWAGSIGVKVTIKLPDEQQTTRLYNFTTKSYEMIRVPGNLSRDQCLDYMPYVGGDAVKLLDQHIAKGHSPYRALILVHLAIRSALHKKSEV